MTTRKITTFLMCPATNGNAMGGTPAANTASGGHIKKSAGWQHVYDLALPALAEIGISEVLRRANDRDQQPSSEDDNISDDLPCERHVNVEQAVRHHQGAKEDHEVGGAHGSGSCLGGRQVQNAIEASRLSLERSNGQPLELKLARIRGVFTPLRDGRRRDIQE